MAGQHPLPGYGDGRGFSIAHQAVDIPAPAGTPVLAMADGVVVAAGPDGLTPYNLDLSESGGGNLVAIRHRLIRGTGQAPIEVVTQYAHLSTISAKVGDHVRAGAQIGTVGSTGNSTGNHLHLATRIGGVWRHYRELLAMPGNLTSAGIPAPPAGYGSGPVQQPPRDPLGAPVSAYPLDEGRTCAPGYNLGTVNPRIQAVPGGLFFNRPTFADGTVLSCIREGLGPGDNAALEDAGAHVTEAIEAAGDIARNFGLFALFAVLLILGAWALVRR